MTARGHKGAVDVETAAGRSIPEIFADLGEPAFRDGERRVIARLLEGPAHVLATGRSHELAEPFQLQRFHTGRLIDEAAAAGIAH